MSPVLTSKRVRARTTWWKTPQRVWLRRAIFQVHLWLGVAITLYAIVIGVSGSILVFRQELQDSIDAKALYVPPQAATITLDRAILQIEAARPNWFAAGLEDFNSHAHAVRLLLRPRLDPDTSNYREVLFDPNTGRELLDHLRYSGFLGWTTNLHFYLLAGKTGLRLSGFMALALLILCVTGLILWWPGVGRWASALILHRRDSWRRFNWDLHSVVGFWSCLALSIVTFTGLYFAFPATITQMIVGISGGAQHTAAKQVEKTVSSGLQQLLTVDQAIAAARAALPPNAPPGYLQLPSKPAEPYRFTGYYLNTAPYSQLAQVTLDPHTGATLAAGNTKAEPLGKRVIQYFFAVHFGSFGGSGVVGILVKILWVLLGITPAILGITGLLMYWNRKLRPLWQSYKRQTASSAHP